MKNRIGSSAIFGILVLVGAAWCQSPIPPTQGASLQESVRLRASKLQKLRVTFKQKTIQLTGSMNKVAMGLTKITKPVPPQETTTHSENKIDFDGEQIRFEDRHPIWNMSTGKLDEKRLMISTTTGTSARAMYLNHEAKIPGGMAGVIERNGAGRNLINPSIIPLQLHCRGKLGSTESNYDLNMYISTGANTLIGGHSCVIYKHRFLTNSGIEYAIDEKRNHCIRRMIEYNATGDKPILVTEIEYVTDAEIAWIPSKWNFVRYDNRTGTLLSTTTIDGLHFDRTQTYPEDYFTPSFPPGSE
jgi:hypothetical protein